MLHAFGGGGGGDPVTVTVTVTGTDPDPVTVTGAHGIRTLQSSVIGTGSIGPFAQSVLTLLSCCMPSAGEAGATQSPSP